MAPEPKAVAPAASVRVAEEGTFPVETTGVSTCVRAGERECAYPEVSEKDLSGLGNTHLFSLSYSSG